VKLIRNVMLFKYMLRSYYELTTLLKLENTQCFELTIDTIVVFIDITFQILLYSYWATTIDQKTACSALEGMSYLFKKKK